MSALHLAPLGAGDFERVSNVTVAPEQLKFSGSVKEAFAEAEDRVDFHGIFRAELAVGFFKIDRGYADRFPFPADGDLGLRAFMVDHALQGQGIATQAVRALPGYLAKHYPDAPAIWLTVNKVNPAALRAYLKGGFEDTGDEWPHGDAGPQHILKLPLG